jgi:CheY-like chemotaxis protein
MDCHMPELGSCDTTRELRQFDNAKVPVIALTITLRHDRELCLSAGMDYASKPVAVRLRELLVKWLPATLVTEITAAVDRR